MRVTNLTVVTVLALGLCYSGLTEFSSVSVLCTKGACLTFSFNVSCLVTVVTPYWGPVVAIAMANRTGAAYIFYLGQSGTWLYG